MNLISKYNIAAPRYTSYPTVPYWEQAPTPAEWNTAVKRAFDESNSGEGISLYVHLPYCESLCTYCACNTRITINHGVEKPYIESLIKEWEMYLAVLGARPRIKEIHLGGGTPTFFSAENLNYLLQSILNSADIATGADFSFEAHPANTTLAHLQILYKLGFRRVSYGIQDFDVRVQDMINRYQTYEEVKKTVDEARETGFTSVNFDLVYGLPLQSTESIIDTISQVNRLRPERIAFYSYAHVPWIKPGQRKFTEKDLPVDAAKRKLYDTGKKLFLEAGYEEIGMDHFSLPDDALNQGMKSGKLHRNFMGYTHNYTKLLIGLGASAISDSWNAFGQNAKTVEDYMAQIRAGHLAVKKGHLLNKEDLVIRKHILNLMCRLETSWSDAQMQFEGLQDALVMLREHESDGLVVFSPQGLSITPAGKAYLRNICLCFDARYWRKQPQSTIFSTSA